MTELGLDLVVYRVLNHRPSYNMVLPHDSHTFTHPVFKISTEDRYQALLHSRYRGTRHTPSGSLQVSMPPTASRLHVLGARHPVVARNKSTLL